MSFSPVLIGTGLAGWNLLNRTKESQITALSRDSYINRQVDYFRQELPNIQSPNDLVNDRGILTVALGAFGLQEDIDNKYFVRRLLDDGTSSPDALSNLLADSRYQSFATAFDFSSPKSMGGDFIEKISSQYISQEFQQLVGDQNPDFRLALNLEREFNNVAQSGLSNDAKWFTIMGNPPMRKVFEVALRLPSSLGNLPIDDQLEILKTRSSSSFGTNDVTHLGSSERLNDIVEKFILQSQILEGNSLSSGSIALTLLRR